MRLALGELGSAAGSLEAVLFAFLHSGGAGQETGLLQEGAVFLVGLQQGAFKFGYAIKLEGSNEYNYYCPDRKVWEEIGYFNAEGKS